MKLLFNEETFSQEFRELLGFVDADIEFTSVKSELLTSTREMISLIGMATYGTFIGLYEKDLRSPEEEEMLQLARYPIAMNTYRLVAPSKDVQHTNAGRLMRTDDQQSRPFEWMIDRNNEANERKYHRGLDDLLAMLFEDAFFHQTPEYSKIKSYFVSSTQDFEEYFPIQSRLLLIKLQPGLRQAERQHIAPLLGNVRYAALKADYASAEGVPGESIGLLELVKEACVYWSLHWAMSRLTVTLLPEGVLQRYTSERQSTRATQPSAVLQAQLVGQKFKEDAERVFREIEEIITAMELEERPTSNGDQEEEEYLFDRNDKFFTT